MRTRFFALAVGLLGLGACNFDITNANQPTLDDLVSHPTRLKLSAAATGVFAGARGGIQSFIWRVGSMGREGINLSGNNQPDFIEPYFGPVEAGGSFGGTQWADRYAHVRSLNIFLAALARVDTLQVAPGEKAAGRAMANTLKALAFMYLIETRAQLGAPVDVDRPVTAAPAPFVSEDSVYKYMVALLDSGASDLARATAASAGFFFPIPPGLAAFNTPATFAKFNRALAAKANVLRATDLTACAGSKTSCYGAALTALGGSFLTNVAAAFPGGAFFDFGIVSGDVQNGLSEPLSSLTFFALQDNVADADTQTNGKKDQRVLDKIVAAPTPQQSLLGTIPIPGTLKFKVFLNDTTADPTHPIPIIRDEELVLLDAEAQWFAGSKVTAIADLSLVRTNSGKLPSTTVTAVAADSVFVKALLYERRYSLVWEQGTRWIDARRFKRLSDIPTDIPTGFATAGNVPPVMPVPQSECDARNLKASQVIADVVTCTPLGP
jgi:hypothetical protein